MKRKIVAIGLSAIIVWSAVGCKKKCPPFCGVAGSINCTLEIVTYHYLTDGVSRTATAGSQCFLPDKDSSGQCPGNAFIIIDDERPFPLNIPGCNGGVPFQWSATSSSLGHLTGQAESDGGWSG